MPETCMKMQKVRVCSQKPLPVCLERLPSACGGCAAGPPKLRVQRKVNRGKLRQEINGHRTKASTGTLPSEAPAVGDPKPADQALQRASQQAAGSLRVGQWAARSPMNIHDPALEAGFLQSGYQALS
jgi:hypothetical protein